MTCLLFCELFKTFALLNFLALSALVSKIFFFSIFIKVFKGFRLCLHVLWHLEMTIVEVDCFCCRLIVLVLAVVVKVFLNVGLEVGYGNF